MNLRALIVNAVAALLYVVTVNAGTIDHDKVQPIPEPEPVTVSEKAGVKYKPELLIELGCVTFAAVNAAGEINGGLKPTGGTSGCEISLLGSQVYGRGTWYNDVWAIMYAWYFPKNFWQMAPTRRHYWANLVVWINNPELESPTMLGISYSRGDNRYSKLTPPPGNATHQSFYHSLQYLAGPPFLDYTIRGGEFQDLIMWEQLPDVAREALSTADFGRAKVPFIDDNFMDKLEKAYPF
ncbi:hypothetical protein PHYBOEH_005945 [Phytophthora boehmeriae]|uniref:Nep1-like protein n=1 Tax=Phytophthora boehmeriae TaxID=109152 RepID=A0A8T1WQ65_9STRA|nr:hypothetical protein PHYBOEH_005945 [Phytophthora boehmeriae]